MPAIETAGEPPFVRKIAFSLLPLDRAQDSIGKERFRHHTGII